MEMVGSVTSKHSYGTYALVGIKQQIIFRPKGVLYQSETSHIKNTRFTTPLLSKLDDH